jgi:hypothetical protein
MAELSDHGARDHAQWSASATERNWNCPGALALTDGLPEKTSEAADWGTCAHQIAEKCILDGVQASGFIGTTQKGKKYEFEVDDEMADTAQVYVDFVRKSAIEAAPPNANPADLLKVEQHFTLASLNPPFEAGGTADAVIYYPAEKKLHVIDLKGGRGHVVEVVGNPQLRTYALGAMLANSDLRVEQVMVTIVQPRAPHKSGRIRSETFHVADLAEWTTDLVAAMHRSADAAKQIAKRPKLDRRNLADITRWSNEDRQEGMSVAEWNSTYLKAGDHCKFCKAAGFCPALERRATDAAGVWFDDLDQPRLSNTPDAMSPEKLAETLGMLGMIKEWCNAVRSYAHGQAESGVDIPGYQLVEEIGNRAWSVPEEQVAGALALAGLTDDRIYVRKLVSPAQAEKALGAKKKGALDGIVERPVRGTNLVASEKSTRPAVPAAVHQHFNVLE